MITVRLIGGLGNQMFQYALGRFLSLKNNTELKLDIAGFESYKLHNYSLDALNIKKTIASEDEIDRFKKYKLRPGRKWFLHNTFIANRSKYFQEKSFEFIPDVLKLGDDVYLDGYWQSEKYFQEIAPAIRNDFAFILPQGDQDLQISKLISGCIAVSINIRRADYVTDATTNSTHGTCSIEYYKEAIKLMTQKVANPHFFVFSDDHEWVKKNIVVNNYHIIYVDHNKADTNFQDMRLMAACKHNIIANSSFSWWGAWLNNNHDKIVIAPQKWFADESKDDSDLIPSSWIRI